MATYKSEILCEIKSSNFENSLNFDLQTWAGQPNLDFRLLNPKTKNAQFQSNLTQTFRKWSIHGAANPWKFEENWSKIVDFLFVVQ